MEHAKSPELLAAYPNSSTFAFVRNPFDRMVSLFFQLSEQASEFIASPDVITADKIHYAKILHLHKQGFDHWVQTIDSYQDLYNIFAPTIGWKFYDQQVSWIDSSTQVFKVEQLATEFVQLQEQFGCAVPLPHLLKSKHNNYQTYYTDASKQLIQELFADDLEQFDYQF
jgi:hypothetical protein